MNEEMKDALETLEYQLNERIAESAWHHKKFRELELEISSIKTVINEMKGQ